ncbi:MAG: nuclear transport factor 2 family protein [Propionibacteriaceae bacterium]|nr:nuclear transport factor 2 family protein [Propionibacteriaceae bacterium]
MAITEQELLDRASIQDVLHRYAQAQDQNRWELYEGVFTVDATVDLVGVALGELTAAQLGAFLKDTFNATRVSGQHLIGNTLYDIGQDTARTVSEVLHHTLQTTDTHGVLRRSTGTSLYADDWLRTADGWRISHRTVTQKHLEEDEVTYSDELLTTIRTGAERVAAWLRREDAE